MKSLVAFVAGLVVGALSGLAVVVAYEVLSKAELAIRLLGLFAR